MNDHNTTPHDHIYIQDGELRELLKNGERNIRVVNEDGELTDTKVKLELTGDAEQLTEQTISEVI